MKRQGDGTWTVSGPAAWRGAAYTFDVKVWSPAAGEGRHQPRDRPLLGGADHQLASSPSSSTSPTRRSRPAGWSRTTPPAIAQPEDRNVYELHVRDFSIGDETVPAAERGTYLAFTRDDSAGMQHLRRLADAGLNTVHLLPAFDIATIEERRSAQQVPDCDLASLPPRLRAPAGVRRGGASRRRLQLGLRPAALHRARGVVRHRPRGHPPHRRVPPDGPGPQRRRAPGRDGRGLQPHRGQRPGPEVGARPDRAGLLPPPRRQGRGRDLHVLLQHRDRAPDDGEADDRLGAHLGARLQGQRLPLRPDGPPLAGEHDPPARRARRAHGRARRRRRQGDLPLRRGLELRRGRRRRPLHPGHPAQPRRHRHRLLQRPAARRRARGRALRRGPARAGLRLRPVHRPQRRRGQRHGRRAARGAAAPAGPGEARPGRQPGRLPLPVLDRRGGGGLRGRLQRPARRLRRRPVGDRHLRRRPRQRDALRLAGLQAAHAVRRWPTGCG